jgi:hypothetical protein
MDPTVVLSKCEAVSVSCERVTLGPQSRVGIAGVTLHGTVSPEVPMSNPVLLCGDEPLGPLGLMQSRHSRTPGGSVERASTRQNRLLGTDWSLNLRLRACKPTGCPCTLTTAKPHPTLSVGYVGFQHKRAPIPIESNITDG